jgi:hypothetical protein
MISSVFVKLTLRASGPPTSISKVVIPGFQQLVLMQSQVADDSVQVIRAYRTLIATLRSWSQNLVLCCQTERGRAGSPRSFE